MLCEFVVADRTAFGDELGAAVVPDDDLDVTGCGFAQALGVFLVLCSGDRDAGVFEDPCDLVTA